MSVFQRKRCADIAKAGGAENLLNCRGNLKKLKEELQSTVMKLMKGRYR